jgi:hypothetical protein
LVVLDLAIEPWQVLVRGSIVVNSMVGLVSSVRVASLPTDNGCLDSTLIVYNTIT